MLIPGFRYWPFVFAFVFLGVLYLLGAFPNRPIKLPSRPTVPGQTPPSLLPPSPTEEEGFTAEDYQFFLQTAAATFYPEREYPGKQETAIRVLGMVSELKKGEIFLSLQRFSDFTAGLVTSFYDVPVGLTLSLWPQLKSELAKKSKKFETFSDQLHLRIGKDGKPVVSHAPPVPMDIIILYGDRRPGAYFRDLYRGQSLNEEQLRRFYQIWPPPR